MNPDEQITVRGGEFRTNLEKRSYRISGDLCLGYPFMGKSTDVAVCRWRWYGRYQMVCLPRDVATVVSLQLPSFSLQEKKLFQKILVA